MNAFYNHECDVHLIRLPLVSETENVSKLMSQSSSDTLTSLIVTCPPEKKKSTACTCGHQTLQNHFVYSESVSLYYYTNVAEQN